MNAITTNGNHIHKFLEQISVPDIKDYSFEAEVYGEKFRVIYCYDKVEETIEIKSIDGHTIVEDFYNESFLSKIDELIWEDLKCHQ